LLATLVQHARDKDSLAGVITFRNHPASVVRPDFKLRYLTSVGDRVDLIKELGVDFVLPITFDTELSHLDVRAFVSKLHDKLRMRELVIGPDFAMGHNRKGDSKTLATLGEEMGFSVSVVDLLVDEGHAVKSTAIRNALARGDVSSVNEMLGRNFSVVGKVVTGMKRGRELGYPTANLETGPDMAFPADGIYATWAHVDGKRHMAATSIGTRPTFDDPGRTIEAYLLDFGGNLYDKELRLEFVKRQRDELRFETVEALLEQIARDVDETRAVLEPGLANSLL
jgi:riboflavin kinase/FMN adenylyltransferase